jgi:hypothetical protein
MPGDQEYLAASLFSTISLLGSFNQTSWTDISDHMLTLDSGYCAVFLVLLVWRHLLQPPQ